MLSFASSFFINTDWFGVFHQSTILAAKCASDWSKFTHNFRAEGFVILFDHHLKVTLCLQYKSELNNLCYFLRWIVYGVLETLSLETKALFSTRVLQQSTCKPPYSLKPRPMFYNIFRFLFCTRWNVFPFWTFPACARILYHCGDFLSHQTSCYSHDFLLLRHYV